MKELYVFHADSLARPMRQLKAAFEAKTPDSSVILVSGKSKVLAEQIIHGDACDVFAPSDPHVITDSPAGTDANGATWCIVFSANEMVIVTSRGNPMGIHRVSDLARTDVTLVRVTPDNDLASFRTRTFVTRATESEGNSGLGQEILQRALAADSIPDALQVLKEGKANTAILYYSSAVSVKGEFHIVRFPASVNVSDQIMNAVTIPRTANQIDTAVHFITLVLSPDGQALLRECGQPPIIPPIRIGPVPPEIIYQEV